MKCRRAAVTCAARWRWWVLCAWLQVLPLFAQQSQPAYVGVPMSMNFQNIEVRTALQIVADFTGLNIITSDSVTGSLTLRLQQVPWDQVLDIITQAKGLSQRRQGHVIWVADNKANAFMPLIYQVARHIICGLHIVHEDG